MLRYAQHDSAVTHTDSWINLLNCIIGPYRCPDYFANDHNRLSIVECGFIQHVSVGTLSSYSPDSPVSCVSNQLRESLRATTAPITVMAGDVMFAFLAHSAIFTSVSVTTRYCGMVPCWITAAGVSAGSPPSSNCWVTCGSVSTPIKMTSVPPQLPTFASVSQFTSAG